ncbi:hypothetical protein [Streptomyces sp. NPDC048057]
MSMPVCHTVRRARSYDDAPDTSRIASRYRSTLLLAATCADLRDRALAGP